MRKKIKALLILIVIIILMNLIICPCFAEDRHLPPSIIVWQDETFEEKIEILTMYIEVLGDQLLLGVWGKFRNIEDRLKELEKKAKEEAIKAKIIKDMTGGFVTPSPMSEEIDRAIKEALKEPRIIDN